MRSPRPAELTTRARIRNAAIERFGRDGFDASLRAIGADAGVSAATIVKQYGSKEKLHEACDEHVLAFIRDNKRETMTADDLGGAFMSQMALLDEFQPVFLYMMRSFMTGGEVARHLIEHMVSDAVEYVREAVAAGKLVPSRDEEARVRYLVGASVGGMMLAVMREERDLASLDRDFWARTMADMALPALEIFTEGFLTDGTILDEYLLYMSDPPESEERSA
ncbi:TetR family transcriptional regulator [Georgenia halophila]|uniref:TetR family transcriptional regulator n=1 Tax=Georgenia halophila TaxID=620889 RepID=A0ABP8LCC0_9MICO